MNPQQSKFLRRVGRLNHGVILVEKSILIVLMLGMLVFGFLQVFSRFVLRAPIGWSEELLTYSFRWASFVGASLAIYSNSHFSVDLVTKHLGKTIQKVVKVAVWTMILAFSLYLLVTGVRLALLNSIQRMNIVPLSMFWAYLSVPVMGLFIVIHGMEKLLEVFFDLHEEEVVE
jgi:TRAP-type C4-dicarboxylate transport system permease small subunit